MLKRIKCFISLSLLKILNFKTLSFNKKMLKISFNSFNTLDISKGKVNFHGAATILEHSKIGVRNSGIINFGNNFYANRNFICMCYKSVVIKDNVSIGPNVCIYDHDHCIGKNGKLSNGYKTGEIIIGNNVWIGAGSIILKNTIIGDNCVIGAGTIVKGNIPPNSLVTSDRKLKITLLKDQ